MDAERGLPVLGAGGRASVFLGRLSTATCSPATPLPGHISLNCLHYRPVLLLFRPGCSVLASSLWREAASQSRTFKFDSTRKSTRASWFTGGTTLGLHGHSCTRRSIALKRLRCPNSRLRFRTCKDMGMSFIPSGPQSNLNVRTNMW